MFFARKGEAIVTMNLKAFRLGKNNTLKIK